MQDTGGTVEPKNLAEYLEGLQARIQKMPVPVRIACSRVLSAISEISEEDTEIVLKEARMTLDMYRKFQPEAVAWVKSQ